MLNSESALWRLETSTRQSGLLEDADELSQAQAGMQKNGVLNEERAGVGKPTITKMM